MARLNISIIIPVYNEKENIVPFLHRLQKTLLVLTEYAYEIIFIADPSTDGTENLIMHMLSKDPRIKLIRMSRRFGQNACIMAGLEYCSGNSCVIMDADLQDPPELIIKMVEKWKEGYEVVYAQRRTRKGENIIKIVTAYIAYWLIDKIAEIQIPRNVGEFRLISRTIIDQLKKFKEHNGFLRGLIPYIGFNQTTILFDRDERYKENGKYNKFFGSFRVGLDGILGFSKYPLHLISIIGILLSAFSLTIGFVYIFLSLSGFKIPWGNPTLVILISFLSGLQLLSLGILGQYFSRMYDEVKGRPNFIVEKIYENTNK